MSVFSGTSLRNLFSLCSFSLIHCLVSLCLFLNFSLNPLMEFLIVLLNSVFWGSSKSFSLANKSKSWRILKGRYCLDLSSSLHFCDKIWICGPLLLVCYGQSRLTQQKTGCCQLKVIYGIKSSEHVHPGLSLGLESLGCGRCSFRREDEVDLPTQTLVQDVQNLAGQRFKYGA